LKKGLNRLPDLELGLTVGVTGRQGMLISPRHLIPPVLFPEVFALFSDLHFLEVYEIDYCSLLNAINKGNLPIVYFLELQDFIMIPSYIYFEFQNLTH
jgi:hypothetical protein